MVLAAVMTSDDRRDSIRVRSLFYVRGLGSDRAWSERLGDIARGGVGFEYPRAPEARRFQVKFCCPGEDVVRTAIADVVDFEPMPGTRDRDAPFFVRLRFSRIDFDDQIALASSLDAMSDSSVSSLPMVWRRMGWG